MLRYLSFVLVVGLCLEFGAAADNDATAEEVLRWIPKSGIGGDVGSDVVAAKTSEQISKLFKGDMKAESLKEGSAKEKKCPKDLDCDFKSNCDWRNVKEDSSDIAAVTMKGTGKPDSKGSFYVYTSSSGQDPPTSPYGLMVGQKGASKNDVWFVSAPMKEQPGDGYVTLRQWSTFKSEIEVCTRKPGSNDLNCRLAAEECSQSDKGKRPLTMYKIKGPIDEPFEIVVKGDFDKSLGGMSLFDDIKYRSELCGQDDAICGDESFNGEKSSTKSKSKSSRGGSGKCRKDSSLCKKISRDVCDKESSFVKSHCQYFCGFCEK